MRAISRCQSVNGILALVCAFFPLFRSVVAIMYVWFNGLWLIFGQPRVAVPVPTPLFLNQPAASISRLRLFADIIDI